MIKIVVVFLLSISVAFSALIVTNETPRIDSFVMEYYFDSSEKLTIKELSKKKFSQTISNSFALGYAKGNHWFKFTLYNNSQKEEFLLYLKEALFEVTNFYEKQQSQWQVSKNGVLTPLEKRNISDPNMAFKFHLQKGESKTYYVQAKSRVTSFGAFELYEYDAFVNEYKLTPIMLYMFYFGVLAFIVLFNFFIYLKLKESIYIYYVGYILFFMIFVFYFSGLHVYIGLEAFHYELHSSAPLFILFLLLFSKKFLEVDKYIPRLAIVYQSVVAILLLLALLIFIDIEPWYQVMNIFATVGFILLIYTSIVTWKRGNEKSKYYLLAISVYMVTIILMSSLANGWFEYTWTNRYAFLFGSCFEIVFFSLMLANRYNEIQNEKLRINQELINMQNQSEKVLKQEVEKQTREIKVINKELSKHLNDNQLLLKELYHRVKNNFHMVVSLLWIEANKAKNENLKTSFTELISRIKSMSTIHSYLYNSESLSQIHSDEYMLKIVNEVVSLYDTKTIEIDSHLQGINLNADNAMILGVIINEVVTNAIKHHSFDEPCRIYISFIASNKRNILLIKDNGEGFDSSKGSSGLGIGLINQFAQKLKNAQTGYENHEGTVFQLIFDADV